MRFLGTLFVILGFGGVALACPIRQRVFVQEAVAIVTPAIVATFVPVAVQVPTYSASYQPQAAIQQAGAATASQASDPMAKILARLEAIEQRLGGGNGSQSPATAGKKADTATIAGLFQAKCAACHAADKAATKGGKFAMFEANGDLRALNALDVAKIAGKTYSGKMPKNGKLTDEEVSGIMDWVDSVANK